MPMIDIFIPEGALGAEAEATLVSELTDILIRHEGLDPGNPRIRDVSWAFVHRPAAIYRAGAPASAPIYRVVPTVPEGQYTDAARVGLVAEVTAAVARAEGGAVEEVGRRVWVFPTELPDGSWGARGAVQRLPAIMRTFGGEPFEELGVRRLAEKRRGDAAVVMEAAARSLGRQVAD